MRRTKIVITLGPSTDKGNTLENAILSGANVLRLNFSHGTQAEHESRAYHAHRIIKKIGYNVALLGDLQGPKIRISKFKKNYVFLTKGNIFILDLELDSRSGNEIAVGINYKNIVNDIRVKDILLLDDGKIKLKVIKINNSCIITQVIVGGKLSNNKGINKLGGGLSADALTKKDQKDIIIASNIGVNYLAVSFPKCPEDLILARKLAKESGSLAKIIAKIERAEIIEDINLMKKIILATDVVMVARGDLGIEIGDTKLIDVQKQIIKYSRQLNRIVITATQMMESMIYNPYPTRAEVMDVANAVLDGTDAVMLSAETATGKYPSETVHKMSDICKGAETVPSINISKHRLDVQFDNIEEAIAMSAMYAANHLKNTRAIVTITESGQSALLTSRINSGLPIFALSKHKNILNLLTLYRGVYPMYFYSQKKGIGISHDAILLLLRHRLVLRDDIIIITQGDIMGYPGQANTHRILKIL